MSETHIFQKHILNLIHDLPLIALDDWYTREEISTIINLGGVLTIIPSEVSSAIQRDSTTSISWNRYSKVTYYLVGDIMGTSPKDRIVALTPYVNCNHFYNKSN